MEDINAISLGGGVQSSALALMAAAGEIGPMPVAAFFGDTKVEPKSVYVWLDWLEKRLPFPVIRASRGDLGESALRLRTSAKTGHRYFGTSLPIYTLGPKGEAGMLRRDCTLDFKVAVVRREAKKLAAERGVALRDRRHPDRPSVAMWIGISTDEAHRMKDSRDFKIRNVWPLIDAGISRADCLRWMESKGYPRPPRSACVFCPYHSDEEWLRLKTEEPEEFAKAVAFEKKLRPVVAASTSLDAVDGFLHETMQPLGDIDFAKLVAEGGRLARRLRAAGQRDLFGNECEGMCGV